MSKYIRPTAEVKCSNPLCNKIFHKIVSEIKRTENRNGGKHFCSLTCHGKINHRQLKSDNTNKGSKLPRDKYTGLKEHLHRARKRSKEVNITLDDLLNIWVVQNGICPYTGIKLIQPIYAKKELLMNKASLDRIDSSIGYVKGNIQFISATANLAKQSMSHEEMIIFCKLITKQWMNAVD